MRCFSIEYNLDNDDSCVTRGKEDNDGKTLTPAMKGKAAHQVLKLATRI